MASYTPNFGLKKPAVNDPYNIADHNLNMDIVDNALDKATPKIGSVKIETSADPGPGWALCNGARVYADELPEMYALLNRDVDKGVFEFLQAPTNCQSVKYINGFVVAPYYTATPTSKYYYKSPLDRTFKTGSIDDAMTDCRSNDILWDGTRYVAMIGSNSSVRFYTATTLDGPWTNTSSISSVGSGYAGRIPFTYANGTYVLVTNPYTGNAYPSVRWSTDLINWNVTLLSSVLEAPLAMFYTGSEWKVLTTTASTNLLVIYTATLISAASWAKNTTATYAYNQLSASGFYRCAEKLNGTYIITIKDSAGYPAILFSTDLVSFTTKRVSSTITSSACWSPAWDGKHFIVLTGSYLLFCETLAGEWQSVVPMLSTGESAGVKYGIVYGDDETILLCSTSISRKCRLLPKISVEHGYAYAKVESEV